MSGAQPPRRAGGFAGTLVRAASWLVPRTRRDDWLREWEAELSVWREAGRATAWSAMGAFPHALCLFWEGWTMGFERLLRDVKVGARALAKRPLFSGTVVATLTIGIGGAVAVFSVVNAVLLRPLPFPDGDRIVVLGEMGEGNTMGTTSFATAVDWRERSTSFEHLAIVRTSTNSLTGEGEPEQLLGLRTSWNYFDVLGAKPALGRLFRKDEDNLAAERVVVLSNGLWSRRFDSDPSVIGRPVTLTGLDYTVIGVMPADFEPIVSSTFFQPAEYWTPLRYEAGSPSACRTCRHLRVVARMRPDVTLEAARAEVSRITMALAAEYPSDYDRPAAMVNTLRDQVAGPVRKALWILLGAVGFVLLIACGNVASLMVARAADRRREVSLRAALGAARADLLSQTLVECALLAGAGGALGTLLGAAATRVLVAFAPPTVQGLDHVGVDGTVQAFALVVTVVTAAVFGVAPVLQSLKASPAEVLKEGGRGTAGGRQRARSVLVVVDVAVAIVLLVGVGLTSRSFLGVLAVDPGFDPAGVVKMQVNAIGPAYADDAPVLALHQDVLRRVLEVPGVETAGMSSQVPLTGNFDRVGLTIEGITEDEPNGGPSPERYAITGDYLGTMRIPLREGREFDGRDAPDATPVLLVNEAFAARYWPDGGAIGHRIRMGSVDDPWRTIIGVVGNVRHYALEQPADLQIYLPQAQWVASYMTLVVRARANSPRRRARRPPGGLDRGPGRPGPAGGHVR